MCCTWVSIKFIPRQVSKWISQTKTASHSLPVSFFQIRKYSLLEFPAFPSSGAIHAGCGGLWGVICHLRTSRRNYIICSQPPAVEPGAGSTCKGFTSTRDNTVQLTDFSSGQDSQGGPAPSSSGSQSPRKWPQLTGWRHFLSDIKCIIYYHNPFSPWGAAGGGFLLLSPFLLLSLCFSTAPTHVRPREVSGEGRRRLYIVWEGFITWNQDIVQLQVWTRGTGTVGCHWVAHGE